MKKIALIGGGMNHVVNHTRKQGFEEGCLELGVKPDKSLMYMDNEAAADVERAVDDAMRRQVDCILCMDDRVCAFALIKLRRDGIRIPEDIKIASFYNSDILNSSIPGITTLQYDPKELGATACRVLFDKLEGKRVDDKQLVGYEVLLKGSTLS